MNDRELADEIDAEVKNERSGKIANLMMRASDALRRREQDAARWRTFRSLPWYEAMYEIADAAPNSNPEYPSCRDEAIDEAIKRSSAPSQS